MVKERLSGKADGATMLIMPNRAPDKPATPALIVKARIFEDATLMPHKEAAVGLALSAFQVLPNLLLSRFLSRNIAIKTTNAAIQKNHLYKVKLSPNLAGGIPAS